MNSNYLTVLEHVIKESAIEKKKNRI